MIMYPFEWRSSSYSAIGNEDALERISLQETLCEVLLGAPECQEGEKERVSVLPPSRRCIQGCVGDESHFIEILLSLCYFS